MIEFEQHVFIGGKTGSGKTVFGATYFRDCAGFCIFFNTNEAYIVEDYADVTIHSIGELNDLMTDDNLSKENLKVCYSPKLAGEDISIEEVATVINMFFAIGSLAKKQVHGDPDNWGTIFIDEVQTWGDKQGHPVIHKLWKRGRSYGIRAVGLSQRPADVSHTILTQSFEHVIFYVGDYDGPYFTKYGIPIEDHMEHIEYKSYRFVIWDGTKITRYDKVQYEE
jgi:hypothetical protein